MRRDIGNHVSTGQYEAAQEVRSELQDDDFIYIAEDVEIRGV